MCLVLNVNRSSRYTWKNPGKSMRARKNDWLAFEIKLICEKSRRLYIRFRITAELRADGIRCGENGVSIQSDDGLRAYIPDSREYSQSDFTVDRPNKAHEFQILRMSGRRKAGCILRQYSICSIIKIVGWVLHEKNRHSYNLRNRVAEHVEQAIVALALEDTSLGQKGEWYLATVGGLHGSCWNCCVWLRIIWRPSKRD